MKYYIFVQFLAVLFLSCNASKWNNNDDNKYEILSINDKFFKDYYLIELIAKEKDTLFVVSYRNINKDSCKYLEYNRKIEIGNLYQMNLMKHKSPFILGSDYLRVNRPSLFYRDKLIWKDDTFKLDIYYSFNLCGNLVK